MESAWIIAQATVPRVLNIIILIFRIEWISASKIYGSPYLARPTQTALLTLITLLDHLCLTKKDTILERKLREIKGLGGKDIYIVLQYSSNETGDSIIDRYSINKFEFDPCGMNVVIKTEITKLQDCNIVELFHYYNLPEQMAYHFNGISSK